MCIFLKMLSINYLSHLFSATSKKIILQLRRFPFTSLDYFLSKTELLVQNYISILLTQNLINIYKLKFKIPYFILKKRVKVIFLY